MKYNESYNSKIELNKNLNKTENDLLFNNSANFKEDNDTYSKSSTSTIKIMYQNNLHNY